ncbi:MAG: helix-turn-helix domain-containing protein [Pseudolabrys sp.]|nr:helix-turn-helix domain-containing protein [Pseudolabrys sp.]
MPVQLQNSASTWKSWNTTRATANHADYWSDVVARGVIHAETRAKDAPRFTGKLASRTVGPARFVSFKTAAHSVSRTARQAGGGEALFMVSLQVKGVSHIVQGDRELRLRPSEIAIVDSARPFQITFPEEVERRLVLMPRALVEPWLVGIERGPVLVPDRTASLQIARLAMLHLTDTNLNWNEGDCGAAVDALSRLLRGALGDGSTPNDAGLADRKDGFRLEAIRQSIRTQLNRRDLTPGAIAAAFGLSTRTLHRIFESEGTSFSRFVMNERLSRARSLIENASPCVSLTQIAMDCGFSEASHFSRSYRSLFGEAPQQTRQRLR